MPALAATHHEPIENRGLKKTQAICATMRKLPDAIHGLLRDDIGFGGDRFYHGLRTDPASL